MLKYIAKMLPYPPTGPSNLIYCIATDSNLREKVKYNPTGDSFEIPISELEKYTTFCNRGWTSEKVIDGTPIHWEIDFNSFYFWIE